ncbi:MAG: YciI family protein [Gammaproteobacteria bacterium]
MLIIELTYKKPLAELDSVLQEHRSFLQRYYDKGILVASGPQIPRTGGIIIALTDETTMRTILKEDPFYQLDLADYRFIIFDPIKYCDALKPLLTT